MFLSILTAATLKFLNELNAGAMEIPEEKELPPPKQLFHCVLVVDFHHWMNGLQTQTRSGCCCTS